MAKPRRGTAKGETALTGARLLVVEARFYDDIADMLLTGQRVLPAAAQQLGFQFDFPNLPEALQACMPL